MKLYLRYTSLLLALLLTLSCLLSLAGCADHQLPGDDIPVQDSSSTDATADTSAEELSGGDLVLFESGKCNYQVIRFEDSSDAAIDAARTIRQTIGDLTGTLPQLATDYKKKGIEYDPNTLAILVGTTRYDETAQVSAGMGYGEYRIKVCGNKLVVAAPFDAGVTAAAKALSTALSQMWDGERLVVPSSFSLTRVVNDQVNAIPLCNGGNYSGIYDAGNNSRMLVLTQSSAELYTDYCATVLSSGYEKYSENEINGMLFSSYVSDTDVLNVIFCKPTKELRVLVDRLRNTALPPSEQDNSYTVTCSSSVSQLGCEFESGGAGIPERQIGMCYIFRLADGSFIIEDGGFDYKLFADRLYQKLIELNGGSNGIVIAAWIFSHMHGDHTGAFAAFTDYYGSRVTVERFIYNIPTDAQYATSGEGTGRSNETKSCMTKYKGAEHIIAHPGQVFHIRNAKLTTLFTYDLRIPHEMARINSSSIVMRIEMEGQSFVMLGDLYTTESEMLARCYGKQLKCDFLQVAHHGGTGGVYETNKLLDPVVLLWPLGEYDYFGVGKWHRSAETYNRYFFESTTLREIIVAGSSDVTLPLPYTYPDKLILPTHSSEK